MKENSFRLNENMSKAFQHHKLFLWALSFSNFGLCVKTVLTVWVRGKTDKMVDERSRRFEGLKSENDVGVVPPFSGTLVASNEMNHFHTTIRIKWL